jgi:plastocyanin
MPARRALLAVVAVLSVAACGGDDDGGSVAAPTEPVTEITITSTGTRYDIESFQVPVGEEITLTYDNQHRGVTHDVHFEDLDVETPLKRGPATDRVTFTVDEPGEHTYVCRVHPSVMKGTMTAVEQG